jgi:hypothetical protein
MHYIKLQGSDGPSPVRGNDVALGSRRGFEGGNTNIFRVRHSRRRQGLGSIVEKLNVQQHLHENFKPPSFENFEL